MASAPPSLLHDTTDLRLALHGDVFLISWTIERVTVEAMEQLIDAQTRMTEERQAPYAVMSLMDGERTTGIEEGARHRIGAHEQAMQTSVVAQAQVVLGSGFMATATRAAIAGISVVTRTPYPAKVFGDVAEGAEFLATIVHTVDPADLTKAAESLLRR